MTADISIVVPVLNEAASLPQLLAAIAGQTMTVREVIVVDAGSTDDSVDIVERWGRRSEELGCERYRVITNPGGLPGANRNRGVTVAAGEWIAFLDAGIEPEPDWIECLWNCAATSGSSAVWGFCDFDANSAFEKAVCALSYGCGTSLAVLPASLFHRSVFRRVGMFLENFRAGEDVLWIRKCESDMGPRTLCDAALVHYRHFPRSLGSLIPKSALYARYAVRAGLRDKQRWVILCLISVMAACLVSIPSLGLLALSGYVFIRGFVEPVYRSRCWRWWGRWPTALLMALPIGLLVDLAKAYGVLVGSVEAFRKPSGLS